MRARCQRHLFGFTLCKNGVSFSASVNSLTVPTSNFLLPLLLSISTKTVLRLCRGTCLYGYPFMHKERLQCW
jgi:hypothetical protein